MPDKTIKKAVEAAPDALEDSAVIEALLAELAALPIIEYEQRRDEAKNRLGIRYSVLDAEVAKRRTAVESDTDTTDTPDARIAPRRPLTGGKESFKEAPQFPVTIISLSMGAGAMV